MTDEVLPGLETGRNGPIPNVVLLGDHNVGGGPLSILVTSFVHFEPHGTTK